MKRATTLPEHVELYRAELSCKIGKDAINSKDQALYPYKVSAMEYAMYNLLSAVEDIAKFLAKSK